MFGEMGWRGGGGGKGGSVVGWLVGELRAVEPQTVTALSVLLATVLCVAAISLYYSRRSGGRLQQLENKLAALEKEARPREALKLVLLHVLELSRRLDRSMTMALYMSETRRRRKERARRPGRPLALEDRAPEARVLTITAQADPPTPTPTSATRPRTLSSQTLTDACSI